MYTNNATSPIRYAKSELTLREFLNFVWRNRWIALASSVLCGLSIGILSEIVTPQYTASITILPVSPSGNGSGLGSLGSTLSHFGGIASIAGINLGHTGGFKAEALATLKSRLVTDKYIVQQNLLPVLFPKAWSRSKNSWKSSDGKSIPSLWDGSQFFSQRIRTLKTDPRTGITVLTIRWSNPTAAAQWANGLVALTNSYLQRQAIDEATRDISYLNQEITRTSIVGVKTAIYNLMEEEIQSEMIARGRKEFALHIIDPAVPPTHPSFPKPLLWSAAGAFFGLFFGFVYAVIRETIKSENDTRLEVTPSPSLNDVT